MFSMNCFLLQYLVIVLILVIITKITNALAVGFAGIGSSVVVLWVAWLLTDFYRKHFMKKVLIAPKGQVVLITGCDSGFGHLTAQSLHRHGFKVIAACLDLNGKGAQALDTMKIKTIAMDVTNEQQIINAKKCVEEYLNEINGQLWAVVNNAGLFAVGLIEWGSIEHLTKVLNVNVVGLTQVTRHFLPLIRNSRGRVINLGSVAGRSTGPGVAFYSMSKHAVISFSDALRREMSVWGVKVITIEPEIYRTPMGSEDNVKGLIEHTWERTAPEVKSDYGTNFFNSMKEWSIRLLHSARSPHEVVEAIVDAVTNVCPKTRYACRGRMMAFFWCFLDYFPYRLTDKLFLLQSLFMTKPKVLENN